MTCSAYPAVIQTQIWLQSNFSRRYKT